MHLDEVSCVRSEESLAECASSYFGIVSPNCRAHFEDASVRCPTGMSVCIFDSRDYIVFERENFIGVG